MIDREAVINRMTRDIFGQKILPNAFRGFYLEHMLAEAIGDDCTLMPSWSPWDLTIGNLQDDFPDRIRVQVKNSAARQEWHAPGDKSSKCEWKLPFSYRAADWERWYGNAPCEAFGYMCDLFILCLHDMEDGEIDQTDPHQWKFYLLPVSGSNQALTRQEMEYAAKRLKETGKRQSTARSARTIENVSGQRPGIEPISISEVTATHIRQLVI